MDVLDTIAKLIPEAHRRVYSGIGIVCWIMKIGDGYDCHFELAEFRKRMDGIFVTNSFSGEAKYMTEEDAIDFARKCALQSITVDEPSRSAMNVFRNNGDFLSLRRDREMLFCCNEFISIWTPSIFRGSIIHGKSYYAGEHIETKLFKGRYDLAELIKKYSA